MSAMSVAVAATMIGVAAASAMGAETAFPDDVGIANIKTKYGAKGDGQTDDTAAIQKALNENVGGIVYVPNGVYIITDTLRYPGRQSDSTIWGQDREKSVLKLKDSCGGFTDARKPKAMIWTGQAPAQRFKNYVRNLTFDTGKGNSGAIGAQFIANNSGAFREVIVRSGDGKGPIGLDLGYTNEQGPCLIKNVTIIGFDVGISCKGAVDSVVMEHVTLQKQNTVGLRNGGQCVSVRGVVSDNAVPAIENSGGGVMCLLDSKLKGGGAAAIVNVKPAMLFARNIETEGYAAAISNDSGEGKGAAAGKVDEFTSHKAMSLFGDAGRSLNLPIKETPDVEWGDVSQWASVVTFGAAPGSQPIGGGGGGKPAGGQKAGGKAGPKGGAKGAPPKGANGPEGASAPTEPAEAEPSGPASKAAKPGAGGDATEAVQKAIDSGALTVYFPKGNYTVEGTVHIRGKVRRIIGLGQEATIRGNGHFQLDDGEAPVVVIENIQGLAKGFVHESKRTCVLRDMAMQAIGGLNTTDGTVVHSSGTLFIEDLVSSVLNFSGGATIWCRQVNTERQGTHMVNDGCTLWILGLKTERGGTLLHTKNGTTEICGGFGYTTTLVEGTPEFIAEDSDVSIAFGGANFARTHGPFDPVVRETRAGQTRDLKSADCPKRAGESALCLFVGRGKAK